MNLPILAWLWVRRLGALRATGAPTFKTFVAIAWPFALFDWVAMTKIGVAADWLEKALEARCPAQVKSSSGWASAS